MMNVMFSAPVPRWRRAILGLGLATMMAGGRGVSVEAASNPVFVKHCMSCHGADGRARTPIGRQLGAKDLALSTLSDEDIRKTILEGRRDGKGTFRMPAFKDRVTAAEVGVLIEYVRGFRKP